MSEVAVARPSEFRAESTAWAIASAGFALAYAPVYWSAAHGVWQTDENGHGPLVLAVVVWIFWSLRRSIEQTPWKSAPIAGWLAFAVGLLLYIVGRAFEISSLEFFSQIFVVAGGLLLLRGVSALRVAWFAIAYLIFMVPLPATLVDAATGPLKQWISSIVQSMLFAVGYPISSSGVILMIGQYQLMVADACSGLNSMFSLSALGTLFMYVVGRRSTLHNAIMLASILPIAFAANIVRVTLLVLLTYHFGDEVGQGFLHGAAGMVLMLVALLIFFVLDAAIAWASGRWASAGAPCAR
jgi:exosortase B